MKTLKLNRKGVSPIIATLLLIVIAVAAAAVTYTFVMGFMSPGGTTTPKGVLSIDDQNLANGNLTIYIRNSGSNVTISDIYVNGTRINTNSYFTHTDLPQELIAKNVTELFISPVSHGNTIRIVCTDTTQITFQVP